MAIRYKVRPTRQLANVPCSTELSALLSCFAATGDLRAAGEGVQGCASAARTLNACMTKPHKGGKGKTGSINYLLTRIKK